MLALGISSLDKDSTVSIVENGNVLFAAGEERFTRKKLQSGFPEKAFIKGLHYVGCKAEDFQVVAYPFFDWQTEYSLFRQNIIDEGYFINNLNYSKVNKKIKGAFKKIPNRDHITIPGLANPNLKMEKPFYYRMMYFFLGREGFFSRKKALNSSEALLSALRKEHKEWQDSLESGLDKHSLTGKLIRFDHHTTHAANAFFASGFDESLIVTLDGYGSGLAGSISIGRDNEIVPLHKLSYPYSMGTFYESVTSSLGYKPGRHEGKIVGLAAYGDPKILADVLADRFVQEDGDFRIVESNNIFFSRYLSVLFPKIDVAAAYQHALEKVVVAYVKHYVEKTGLTSIVMSGGVVANVKLNQRIFNIPGVERIFIYPNMGDGGCATGAAFLAMLDHMPHRDPFTNVYFGPDYSDNVIKSVLLAEGLEYEHHEQIEPLIARFINEGKVVARFNGRMEYGPRALGNRSILYRASEPDVNQWLNKQLGRTEFMPFAPATLFEERHRCYKNLSGADFTSQFMTITFDCTREMIEKCPAAVHVDGTARPQLVSHDINPSFHKIISEYFKISGTPTIINTSFNMHEEPIVNSPEDAVRAFLLGNLDYLAIGNFMVSHPKKK
jgi:carbamoyltransferase